MPKAALPFTGEFPEPVYDPSGWAEDFSRWVLAVCIFRDGSCGGVAALHRDWCEWCYRERVVPMNLPTFRAMHAVEGFTLTEPSALAEHGIVYGLLLREDWEGYT